MMPKKSGFLVLEKLKGRPGGLIPTIMITGNEGSRHRAYAEMLGVRDYIRKPFAPWKSSSARSRRSLKGGSIRPARTTDRVFLIPPWWSLSDTTVRGWDNQAGGAESPERSTEAL